MSKQRFSAPFLVIAVLFSVCLVTSNFFVARMWQVGRLPLQLPAAVLLFPVSYILNDALTEVYGYRRNRLVIWIAFAMSVFTALMSGLATILPEPLDQGSLPLARHFDSIFGMVPRTTIASLLAFLVGSTINALIMSRMKVKTKGRGFGWRAILSSIGGEAADSMIFLPIVFTGILEPSTMLALAFTQVGTKVLYEIIALPLTSVFVRILKHKEGLDTYDDGISYNPFKIKDI